jgi:arsenate reductase (thioredoxin)
MSAATNVLFLCGENSARSIMAEAILERFGAGDFRAFSAGIRSRGEIHPYAIQTLRDIGLPVSNLNAKLSTDFLEEKAPRIDYAITVSGRPDESTLTSLPTNPKWAFWNISDPQEERGPEHLKRHAFRRTFRELETRIRLFVLVNSPQRTKSAQAA